MKNINIKMFCGQLKCFIRHLKNRSIGYMLVSVDTSQEKDKDQRIKKRYKYAYDLSLKLEQDYPQIPTLYLPNDDSDGQKKENSKPYYLSNLRKEYAERLQTTYYNTYYLHNTNGKDIQPDIRFYVGGTLHIQKLLVVPNLDD